jgi:hypothetical protein
MTCVSDLKGEQNMSDRMRGLDSAAAFREAIYRSVPFGILAAFVGATFCYMSHWYNPQLAKVLFVALSVSGFTATLSLLVAYYHRRVLLGLAAAVGAFVLPIVAVLGSIYVARIPLKNTPLWTVIPAGIAGELVFKIVQRFNDRNMPTINTFRS